MIKEPGRATEADWVRWLHHRTRQSEARRLVNRNAGATDAQVRQRVLDARAKRARRNVKHLDALVLK